VLSKSYAAPLHVVPNQSNWLRLYFIFTLTFLLVALAIAPFPSGLKPVLLFVGLTLLWFQWLRYGIQKDDRAVKEALWQEDGVWILTLGTGEQVNAYLQRPVYCQRLLVILNFVTDDRERLTLVLPADTLSNDTHRHLRARIRLEMG